MKKFILVIMLIMANAMMFAQIKNTTDSDAEVVVTIDTVETMTKVETSECAAGGIGSISCSLDGTIAGIGLKCSVTCESGYYACCSLEGCHCMKNK